MMHHPWRVLLINVSDNKWFKMSTQLMNVPHHCRAVLFSKPMNAFGIRPVVVTTQSWLPLITDAQSFYFFRFRIKSVCLFIFFYFFACVLPPTMAESLRITSTCSRRYRLLGENPKNMLQNNLQSVCRTIDHRVHCIEYIVHGDGSPWYGERHRKRFEISQLRKPDGCMQFC